MERKIERRTFTTNCSPSFLINNLILTKSSLIYVHNSEANPRVISIDKQYFENKKIEKNINFNNPDKKEIYCIKQITLNNNENYVGIGYYGSFKLWTEKGDKVVYQYVPSNVKPTKIYTITSISLFSEKSKNFYDSIILCDNYGQIHIIKGNNPNWNRVQIFSPNLSGYNPEGIISCCSLVGYKFIGVCYDNAKTGLLLYENNKTSVLKNMYLSLPSLCSVMMEIKKQCFFVFGFMNGEIKFFNCHSLTFEFSISSHVREIICLFSYGNYIFSGSPDCCVNGFKINEDKTVEVIINDEIEDRIITGIAYDKDKKSIYLAPSDFPEIRVIQGIDLN